MKKLFKLLALVALSGALLTGCGQKEDKNLLKVGLECAYPPFNWTQIDDRNGGVEIIGSMEYAGGYDLEIAKKIAKEMGKELRVVKIEWDGLVPALNSDKIDLIIAGMSPTEERRKALDFSKPYYHSDLVMVVDREGDFKDARTLEDFKNARVTGQLNTFHYSVIDQIPGVVKNTAMESFTTMRVALESGMIDAYVSEKPEAISAENNNKRFKMIELDQGFKANTDDLSIAAGLKKGSKLMEEVDRAIEKISKEEREELMEKSVKNQPAGN